MNFYLIEKDKPDVKLRHYKNSRVPAYTVHCLNHEAGYEKYAFVQDETPVVVARLNQY